MDGQTNRPKLFFTKNPNLKFRKNIFFWGGGR